MAKPVIILSESTTEKELRAMEHELPTDTHLVRYRKKSWKKKEAIAAVKAFRMVDIFDQFHDQGLVVLEISQGYGKIKPKLWTPPNEISI